MNKEDLDRALSFAKTFGQDYKKFEKEVEIMHDRIRYMKQTLTEMDKCLRGKIE